MNEYHQLVKNVLENGVYRPNRTGVDTISSRVPQTYNIDLQDGFPLLTTKKMDGFRWESMLYELLWYLDGEHHIRNLREHTQIWDAWADDDHNLPSAYGRFWRRYPLPSSNDRLSGEWWADENADWIPWAADHYDTTEDEIQAAINRWLNDEDGFKTFDQIQYIIDTLQGENPMRGPNSRRLMVSAWHPANADVSRLPPCHAFWGVRVVGDRLDLHLTQRSGDVALGIPFNIAAYSLLLKILAKRTGYKPGTFSHTIIDAHIYCGKSDRGEWYAENLDQLRPMMEVASEHEPAVESSYASIREWIQDEAPAEQDGEENMDHVPGLLKQLTREPRDRPTLSVPDKPLDELEFEDFQLENYDPHDGIKFGVAE